VCATWLVIVASICWIFAPDVELLTEPAVDAVPDLVELGVDAVEGMDLGQVIVRIVSTKAWSVDHSHQLRQAVHEFFESAIQMDLEITERLALPHRGKLQSMMCEALLINENTKQFGQFT
jgi:hypothetical protein